MKEDGGLACLWRSKRIGVRATIAFLCLFFTVVSKTGATGRTIDFHPANVPAAATSKKTVEQTEQMSWDNTGKQEVRVGLFLKQRTMLVSSDKGFSLIDEKSGKVLSNIAPNSAIKLEEKQGGILLDGKLLLTESFRLVPKTKEGIFMLGTKHYHGMMMVRLHGTSFDIINIVELEDYVNGVLPEEMPSSWPAEALKAQAVAARTYGLRNRLRHKTEDYSVCATTHCQIYGGIDVETAATREAVAATSGEVLFYANKPAEALFHSDSGGMTESSEAVWGNAVPYLLPVKEDVLGTGAWQQTFSEERIAEKLAGKGVSIGRLKKIELSPLVIGKGRGDRSVSGRVLRVVFYGAQGSITLTGSEVRSLFGLKSTLFDIRWEKKFDGKGQVIISGFGNGHGIGLSQYGAKNLAKRMKYTDILAHYYPGTTLRRLK